MDNKITFEEAMQLIPQIISKMGVLETVIKSIQDKVIPSMEEPITLEEASSILRKKPNTIYQKCSNGEIPHFNQGQLYFFKSELIQWIRAGRIKTKDDLNQIADEYLINKK